MHLIGSRPGVVIAGFAVTGALIANGSEPAAAQVLPGPPREHADCAPG